jgi:heptosyltransferase III
VKERGNTLLKIADQYVGIPLVAILGLFRKKRKLDSSSLRRAGARFTFLVTGAIGDTVLASAILTEVKRQFPDSETTLVVSRGNVPVVSLFAAVDHIVIFEMADPVRSLRTVSKLEKSDLLIDFAPWPRINSLIAYSVRANFKIGFKRRNMFRHYVFDVAVEHSDACHEIENYRNLLRAANVSIEGCLPSLVIGQDVLDKVVSVLDHTRKNVVIHPFPGGSKKELKEWPRESWVKASKHLIRNGCSVFITGDRNDASAADAIRQGLGPDAVHCRVLCGNFSLAEVAGILYKSSLFITVNTGVMHIGAALNVSMIALHGPTSPLRWGPLSAKAVVVTPKSGCAPCLSLGFDYGCSTGGCMETIAVEDILRQADRLLTKPANQEPRREGGPIKR